MARPFQFPRPRMRSPDRPSAFCAPGRMLSLYNEANPADEKSRVSKKVRSWFRTQALSVGWSAVEFVLDVETDHSAGCMLWVRQNHTKLKLKAAFLVLTGADESD